MDLGDRTERFRFLIREAGLRAAVMNFPDGGGDLEHEQHVETSQVSAQSTWKNPSASMSRF
jgi:hypothetical protein